MTAPAMLFQSSASRIFLTTLCSPSLLIGDAINGIRRIVGNQQRAIRHHLHIDRPSPRAAVLEPAFGERLPLYGLVVFDANGHYAITDRSRTVPGTVFGDKNLILVFGWKHRSRIEAHSESGHVSRQF